MAQLTTRDLAQAKEAVSAVLEQLGLATYLFDVEPTDKGPWSVRIDCPAGGAWQSLTVPVDADRLVQTTRDAGARGELAAEWRRILAECAATGSDRTTGS